jgi:hypothetical protein
MVRPQVIPEQLRLEIERRILTERQSHQDVLRWLAGQGYICQRLTLLRRCKEWGISRRGVTEDPFIVEYINSQFHTTLNDDSTIASQLNSQGYSITASGVKELRLTKSWRHRQPTVQQQQD